MHYKYRKVIDTRTQPYPPVIHALPPRCMTGPFTRAEQCSPPAPARIEKYVLTGRLSPLSEVRLAPDSRIRELGEDRNIRRCPQPLHPPPTQLSYACGMLLNAPARCK